MARHSACHGYADARRMMVNTDARAIAVWGGALLRLFPIRWQYRVFPSFSSSAWFQTPPDAIVSAYQRHAID